jgi:UPF0716 protein FxsA
MRVALLLVFIAFPLLELALLIKVGQWIGFWWTMLILVGTAIGGSAVLHEQGFSAMRRMMQATREGRPPIEPVTDSLFLLMAGLLLLTPGLISDALGCLLLIPQLRRAIARWALARLFAGGAFRVDTHTFGSPPGERPREAGRGTRDTGVVIDGEWEHVDQPESNRPGPASGAQDRRHDKGSEPKDRG